jgi:hypothetical protein
LFIEVPNAGTNPFDYTVADHLMHFTPETLAYLVRRAGFHVRCIATDWVAKEISVVAVPQLNEDARPQAPSGGAYRNVIEQVNWLRRFNRAAVQSAVTKATATPFGVFGTSVAAAWLWPAVSNWVEFFVEEDVNRIGRTYMGRPVISPTQTPPGAVVFLALVPQMAAAIRARLKTLPIDFHMPPPLP